MVKLSTLFVAFSLSVSTSAAEFKVGDDAPPLKIAKWVKGKPVDLKDGKGKQIYVVEFWATWCGPCVRGIPHINRLARHFEKKGVTFIAVSIDGEKTVARVEPFVKERGDGMSYTVALDDGEATSSAWMDAAGVNGIPHAFVIGKDGKLAWHGHPLDGMDKTLAVMVGEDPLVLLDELIQEDPKDVGQKLQKYVLLLEAKRKEDAAKWGRMLVKETDVAQALNELSWGILTEEKLEGMRDIPLALAAAKKANDLSGQKDWAILDTYARALFDSSEKGEAVAVQRKAVEIVKEATETNERLAPAVEQLEEVLERYLKAAGDSGAGASSDSPPAEPGFASLFDGKDIGRHFIIKGNPASWQTIDGVIRSTPGGDRIISKEKYGDFILRLEWRVSKGGNSGVFLRVPSQNDGAPWESGIEVQISNEPRDDAHCTGSLYGVEPVKPRPDEADGVWHTFEIESAGKRVRVKSDGVVCIDAHSDKNPALAKRSTDGYIGLQDSHSGAGSTIEYRNIRIRALSRE